MKHTLRGIATISLWAKDHEAAVAWYSELFDMKPYFTRPGYVEFRVGDYQTEVGIIDSKYAPEPIAAKAPAGMVTYWQVDDVNEIFERLLSLGAKQLEAPVDRGHGFVTASVVDPFGNILGVMYNPHYLEVLGSDKKI
ncbi:MAG: VOC family protein [Chloroflexi bacterium]|nr:VOC family protein [Chloroflexota bacterium]